MNMSSIPKGGEFKEWENDSDHLEREEIFREMWILMRRVEVDIKNDDCRLCNHMSKDEMDYCFPPEAMWPDWGPKKYHI